MTARLPGVLADIAAVAGLPAAIAFAARVGGTRVYIPRRVTADHWLADCLGRDAADKVCAHIGGGHVDVPLAASGAYHQLKRAIARRVHELDGAGLPAATIARRVGITARTVHNHRAAHRPKRSKLL